MWALWLGEDITFTEKALSEAVWATLEKSLLVRSLILVLVFGILFPLPLLLEALIRPCLTVAFEKEKNEQEAGDIMLLLADTPEAAEDSFYFKNFS